MSIFGKLKNAIFGSAEARELQEAPAAAPGRTPAAAPGGTPAAAPQAAPQTAAAPEPAAEKKPVDVEAVLDYMAKKRGQPNNWRTSIVDLMKLVNMDSSLAARKELAQDLGYTGELNGSAEMNIWLHQKVMARLAQERV
jgi:3-oxoacyl-ACP reductase-like protein